MEDIQKPADICLILEGTYPYVTGGVSQWTHDLIRMHPEKTFHLLALLPPQGEFSMRYELPLNVLSLTTVRLQQIPEGEHKVARKKREKFFYSLERDLLSFQYKPSLKNLANIIRVVREEEGVGNEELMRSYEIWKMIVRMYNSTVGDSSFLDYFWSWRGLLGGLFSVLLAPLPNAYVYHALCTGYAGLLMSRAKIEKKVPCFITEHGIYTNERKIEIASADWLYEGERVEYAIEQVRFERNLKDLWIDTFTAYSTLAYIAADLIITLYKGNQVLQIADGAPQEKLRIIPNGIDVELFSTVERVEHPKRVAFVGRVVPIKDVKTFIRSILHIKEFFPDIEAWIVGPYYEDPTYYEECNHLVKELDLTKNISFLGKKRVTEILGQIDVLVLTSISEAQPLTLLEAGAVGVPVVTTDVGSCRDIVEGTQEELPPLGPGGIVTSLVDPQSTAEACLQLLLNPDLNAFMGQNLKKRVYAFYTKAQQQKSYEEIYDEFIKQGKEVMEKKESLAAL